MSSSIPVTLAGYLFILLQNAGNSAGTTENADELRNRIEQRVASLLPTPEEDAYLSVRWRQNLMAARSEAQDAGKPLFLWIMNGHPLGCV